MKININQRSTDELLAVMDHLGHRSPSHTVQSLITQLYKSIPIVEDNNNNAQSQNLPPLQD